jgi:hypothetical protein
MRVDFTIASLDTPRAVRPVVHIFFAERVGWFNPGDTFPRPDAFHPNTRGL